jgi:hypothetical protein
MPVDKLTPADPNDLAAALAFALRFEGRKRVYNADEIIAEIVAKRLVGYRRGGARARIRRMIAAILAIRLQAESLIASPSSEIGD